MHPARMYSRLLAIAIVAVPLCLVGQTSTAVGQTTATARLWSEKRELSFEDFLAAPDTRSRSAALTAYTIQARANCQGTRQTYGVDVLFMPGQSWIKSNQRISRILAHEQGHFDLGEVSARRLRAALAELDAPCEAGDAGFRKVVEEFRKRDADLQRSYERQTMYGVSAGPQRQWDAKIKSWLRKEKP